MIFLRKQYSWSLIKISQIINCNYVICSSMGLNSKKNRVKIYKFFRIIILRKRIFLLNMSKFENHKKTYLNFKKDAENEVNSKLSRAELYFLSIYHLIECCAAKYRVHVNKHQKVRIVLENNPNIFEKETENVWRLFQDIENKIRPKFTYGFSGTEDDFNVLKEKYYKLEEICNQVLLDES